MNPIQNSSQMGGLENKNVQIQKTDALKSLFAFIETAKIKLEDSDASFSSYSSNDEKRNEIKTLTINLMNDIADQATIENEEIWRSIQSIIGYACDLDAKEEIEAFVKFRINQEKISLQNRTVFKEDAKKFVDLQFPLGLRQGSEIAFTNADAHHGGKVPFSCEIVTRRASGFLCCKRPEQTKKVFIKPRNSDIDIAILKLFRNLNQIQHKSIAVDLPVYEVENALNFSVWEFIDGHEPGLGFTFISPFLNQIEASETVKQNLRLKLSRLEQVAKAIGLSDLHGENVIFTNLKKDTHSGKFVIISPAREIDIVPIDLESIQKDSATGLIEKNADVDIKSFNLEEQTLIDNFKNSLVKIPFRLVPLKTTEFIQYIGDPEQIEDVKELVIQKLTSLELNFTQNDVEIFIEKCFEGKEVPFFTQIGKQLYTGAKK